MIAWIGWIGAGTVAVGLLCVLAGIRGPGVLARLRYLVIGVLVIAMGSLGMGLGLALHGFTEFSRQTLVAKAVCIPTAPGEFTLRYAAAVDGLMGVPMDIPLRGDQWEISGDVVKWHPWLTALGVPSYHKPTRLRGRFASAAQERAHAPSLVELNGGEDALWTWLYRLDPWLPFVEAAYGSAAYVPADPSRQFLILVSPFGYSIQRAQ